MMLRFRFLFAAPALLVIFLSSAALHTAFAQRQPVLISEPDSTRAIALDSVTFKSEPFSPTEPISFGADSRTRIILFALYLTPPPDANDPLTAEAMDGSGTVYSLSVEYVGPLPGYSYLTQIVLCLPDQIGDVGDVLVQITLRGVASNRVRIGIGHVGDGPPDDAGAQPTPAPALPVRVVDAAGGGDFTSIADAFVTTTTGTQTPPASGTTTIIVRSGTYAGGFSVPANTTLIADGDVKILAPVGGGANGVNITAPNVTLDGFEIDGQRNSQPDSQSNTSLCGVYVDAPSVTLTNMYVHDTRNIGVSVQSNASDFKLFNSRIENSATTNAPGGTAGYHYIGVWCNRAARPQIINNTIRGWSQAVGLWYGVNNAIVENNNILDNYGFADDAHTTPRSAVEDYGADVLSHGHNLIENNTIDGTTAYCIEIAQGVVGSVYRNNVLRNAGKISSYGAPLAVTGQSGQITTDILIDGNTISSDGTRDESCAVNGQAYRITITNNTFDGFNNSNGQGALFVGGIGGVEQVVIEGNEFRNSRFGVRLNNNGDGMIIRGNRFIGGTGQDAIYVASGNKHIIDDNTISGGNRGIALLAGTAHQVTNNTVSVDAYGLLVMTSDNVITGNNLTEGLYNNGAVRLDGALALRNTIQNNTLKGSPTYNIGCLLVGGADYNVVTNNNLLNGAQISDQSGASHNILGPNSD